MAKKKSSKDANGHGQRPPMSPSELAAQIIRVCGDIVSALGHPTVGDTMSRSCLDMHYPERRVDRDMLERSTAKMYRMLRYGRVRDV